MKVLQHTRNKRNLFFKPDRADRNYRDRLLSVFMADGINNVDLRNVRKIYHFLTEKDQAFQGGAYEGHIDDSFILRLFDNSEENRQSYIKILNLSWSHRFFFYEVKGLEDMIKIWTLS